MAKASAKSNVVRWRLWLALAALLLVFVSTGWAAIRLHRYAVTDTRFTLSSDDKEALKIEGLNYVAGARVARVFASDFGRSVFSIPLAERRRRLLAISWVEDASVSRLWPDRLAVRIRERKPVAFVSAPSGPLLVDAAGVLLDPPSRAQFAFPVLNGVRQEEPEELRRERVRAYLRLQQDMGNLANDVSEVDVSDLENLRIVARVNDRAIELMLGDEHFAARYRNFLASYPEIQKQSPDARTFDLRLEDRITARK
jgi:cell division protein FtsQ